MSEPGSEDPVAGANASEEELEIDDPASLLASLHSRDNSAQEFLNFRQRIENVMIRVNEALNDSTRHVDHLVPDLRLLRQFQRRMELLDEHRDRYRRLPQEQQQLVNRRRVLGAARVSSPDRPNVPELKEDKIEVSCNSRSDYSSMQYLKRREVHGTAGVAFQQTYQGNVSRRLPSILKEHEFELGTMNKIFASAWLDTKQVVFGTKCNQLVVMNVLTGKMTTIPTLNSSKKSEAPDTPCGIHGISINPSGTMLATGGTNTNDVGIYKLPTFDPYCVGEGGHNDWLFDLEWVDDEFLISGSRDNGIALWRINNMDESEKPGMSCLYVPEYGVREPLVVMECKHAQKVRALSINRTTRQMAVLSLNSMIHLWNIETFQQIWSRTLRCARENVCMAVSEEKNLYAVGSHNLVTLVDCRKEISQQVNTKQQEHGLFQGIRSLSFRGDIVTIGTGTGLIMFYDLRAGKYLESSCKQACQLSVGQGWLKQDDNYRDIFVGATYPNAVYTHGYDAAGVRLFAAGGPLPAGLWGNYAALWA